jgi:hypothetical protein
MAGLQWVASHANRNGPEPWLNEYVDFDRVFVGGDSGGGNTSHTLAVRVGTLGLPGVKLVGMILVHPFFGGMEDDHMWLYMCPTNGGLEDPRLKPSAEDLRKLGCERVLIFFAQNDHLEHPLQPLQIWLFKITKNTLLVILTAHLFRAHFSASLL